MKLYDNAVFVPHLDADVGVSTTSPRPPFVPRISRASHATPFSSASHASSPSPTMELPWPVMRFMELRAMTKAELKRELAGLSVLAEGVRVPDRAPKERLLQAYLAAKHTALLGHAPMFANWTLGALRKHVAGRVAISVGDIHRALGTTGAALKKADWVMLAIVGELAREPGAHAHTSPCADEIARLRAFLEEEFAGCRRPRRGTA